MPFSGLFFHFDDRFSRPSAQGVARMMGGAGRSSMALLEESPPLLVGLAPPSALDLDPVGRTTRAVGRVDPLGHDALEPAFLACGEQPMRIIKGTGEQDGRTIEALDEGLQLRAALHERQVEQILAVEMQQVERPQAQFT
jgi:hypothetical protein